MKTYEQSSYFSSDEYVNTNIKGGGYLWEEGIVSCTVKMNSYNNTCMSTEVLDKLSNKPSIDLLFTSKVCRPVTHFLQWDYVDRKLLGWSKKCRFFLHRLKLV